MAKKKYSKEQLRAIHAKRPYQAHNRDGSQRAQHTYPDTAENRALWVANPRRVDIEGLDTPKRNPSAPFEKHNDKIFGRGFEDIKCAQQKKPLDDLVPSGESKTSDEQIEIAKSQLNKNRPTQNTEFKADTSLINSDLARNAHSGTSFDPEKRAKGEIQSFEIEVNNAYEQLKPYAETDEQKQELKLKMEDFQTRYANKYNDTLVSRGRMLSPMITGPANFPTRRNEKAFDVHGRKVNAMLEFRSKFINRVERDFNRERKKAAVDEAGGEHALLMHKIHNAEQHQQHMKDSNRVIRNTKTTDDEKIKKLVDTQGISEDKARTLIKRDVVGDIGYGSYRLTNNSANIRRMKTQADVMERHEQIETTSKPFEGGKITDNKEDDRVQIFFDSKPEVDMRKKLKGSGWRWAPSTGAWQRKRTNAAMYSAKQITETAE